MHTSGQGINMDCCITSCTLHPLQGAAKTKAVVTCTTMGTASKMMAAMKASAPKAVNAFKVRGGLHQGQATAMLTI